MQAIVDAVKRKGLASATVAKTHRILSAAFAYGVENDMLMSNPCSGVKLPKMRRSKLRVPSGEKVGRILTASKDHPLHPVLVVLAYCGLRRSEALGLAWGDIDPDWTTLTIERAVAETEQGLTFEPTKTEAGQREVPLHPVVVEVLKAHKARQAERRLRLGPGWTDPLADRGGIVFDNIEGLTAEKAKDRSLAIHPHRVTLYFRRLTTRLGMPEVRLHDLRHFAATTALKGEQDVIVSRMLGHSKTQTTKDLYFDFIPADATGASKAIGKAIEWDR